MAMSSATQISDSTRNKIIAAIGSMTDLYKAGSTPNDALSEVATKHNLLPDQLRIVGRGFNSGQTLTEIGEGETLAEKTAGVRPLVDIEGVIREVYSTDKKLVGNKQAEGVSSVYLQDPALFRMGKAASVPTPVHAEPADERLSSPPIWVAPNLYDAAEKQAAICNLRNEIHAADRQAHVAATHCKMALSSLLDEFKRHMDSPEKVANLLFDAKRFHGEQGLTLLKLAADKLAKSRAGTLLTKAASLNPNGNRVIPSVAAHPLMFKLAAACEASHKADKMEKNQINKRMNAAKVQRLIEGKEKVARLVGPDMGSYGKQVEQHLHKFAINVGGILGGLAAGKATGSGPDPNSSKFREAELAMEDPQHDQALQKIRLRATLQNLMDYDPIIQSYDPDEVLTAFNELSQSAPASIDNPVMLTANLRRLLQGDVAPFEAVQMQSADAEQRKLIEPMQAQLKTQ